jgi:hypothetical protein
MAQCRVLRSVLLLAPRADKFDLDTMVMDIVVFQGVV